MKYPKQWRVPNKGHLFSEHCRFVYSGPSLFFPIHLPESPHAVCPHFCKKWIQVKSFREISTWSLCRQPQKLLAELGKSISDSTVVFKATVRVV